MNGAPEKRRFWPEWRNWRFWGAQGIVLVLAGLHWWSGRFYSDTTALYLALAGLMLVPLAYAALKFGMGGALITALWVAITIIPQWRLLIDPGRSAEMVILVILAAAGVVTGYQADARRAAERKAAMAAADAARSGEMERQRISGDLHDDTLQELVVVCQQLDRLKNSGEPLPPAAVADLGMVREEVKGVMTGIRNIIKGPG